jgi:V8-like Glu-specific endopeptidase
MVQHTLVEGSGNFYYVKASKTTWAALRNARGMTSFPSALNRATPPATPESVAAAEAAAAGLVSPAVAIDDVSNIATAAAESGPSTTDATDVESAAADVVDSNTTSAPVADDVGRHHHHRRALQQLRDNRFRPANLASTFPFWNIGQLTFRSNRGGLLCSASLFSPDDILTAAHCVVDSITGEAYRDFRFAPAKDGENEPFGR